jgi:excisionase family DNA binding protein
MPELTATQLQAELSNGPDDLEVPSTAAQHAPAPPASLVDIPGLADRLGTSVRHVRRLVATKAIPYVKVGHLIRFDPEDITDWIERNMVQAEKPKVERDSS